VYRQVRESLVAGDLRTANKLLHQAAERGAGAQRQAYRLRQQLLSQPTITADAGHRLLLFDAMNARERGDLSSAIRKINEVINSGHESVFSDDAQNLLAYISLVDRLDYPSAQRQYQRLRKNYPQSSYYDAALFGEALAAEKNGAYEDARTLQQALMEKHTGVSVGFLNIAYPKDNLLSRLWFNRAKAKLTSLEGRSTPSPETHKSPGLIMGARLSYDYPVGSGKDFKSTAHRLQKHNVPATHIAHWLTENTAWKWESAEKIAAASRAGYTPVLIDWYFGDKISPARVADSRAHYLRRLQTKIIPLLAKSPGAMIILEPEFNKNGIDQWPPWGELMLESIRMIHQQTNARVGLAIGDWANFDDTESLRAVKQAIDESDFIAFLVMTSREHEGGYHSPANDFGSRFNRAMIALEERYDLPIVLAYTAISSADGWQSQQAQSVKELMSLTNSYDGDRLEAIGYFSLFDNPTQTGWFGRSETKFGLLNHKGVAKPALNEWRVGAQKLWAQDKTSPVLTSSSFTSPNKGELAFQGSFSEWVRWDFFITAPEGRPIRRAQGTGREVSATFNLATLSRTNAGTITATLLANDAAGNNLERSFTTTAAQATPHLNVQRLPTTHWVSTRGLKKNSMRHSKIALEFTKPFGQLRMPVDNLSARSTLFFDITSDEALHGLYLGAEDHNGTRVRLSLDYLLPSVKTQESTRIVVPIKDLLQAKQNLNVSGQPIKISASPPWQALVLENSASELSFTLGSLSIVTEQQPAGRPLILSRGGY